MGWLIWKERKRKIRGGSLWASGPDCASKMLFSSVFPRLSARSDTTSLYIYNIMISLYITHLQKSIQISIRDHKKGIRVWSFPNSQIIRSQTSILSSCKIFGIWRLIIFRTFGSFYFFRDFGILFVFDLSSCPANFALGNELKEISGTEKSLIRICELYERIVFLIVHDFHALHIAVHSFIYMLRFEN